MRSEIDGIVDEGRISSKQAAQLRGKLSFAEAQSFARWSRFHRSALDSYANGVGSFAVTPELREELLSLKLLLESAPPRSVKVATDSDKLMVFTDGAVEDRIATYAGVLIDMTRRRAHYFSGQVPHLVMSAWSGAGTRHPVAYAEMAP
eukprot:520557-Amphidinium_carterae.1